SGRFPPYPIFLLDPEPDRDCAGHDRASGRRRGDPRAKARFRPSEAQGGHMAQVATAAPDQAAESKPHRGPIDWWGGHRLTFVGPLIFIVIAAAIRIWQQGNAWTIGIDASSPGFTRTYRVLFYSEVLASGVIGLWWWTYLIKKGRKIVDVAIPHEVEVRRIANFWGLISTISVELTIMASFWPN